ncbi:MAG: glycine cleavage system aminomethyltransferase GcvT [Candidatus Hinthialibacter antarcticus]|nr:glycine cleavage system aminomethyltransferase GcvT [Candidatus Hinthialibacter antarcticus]
MTLQTALHQLHESEGARLVDFAGWHMPLQYASITAEHGFVRESAGVFDVGHMGRFFVSGPKAADALARVTVSRIHDMEIGQTRYTLVCNHAGGARDDILVNRIGDENFLVVVNASNREKLWQWFSSHFEPEVEFVDKTLETGMIAVQGPNAEEIIINTLGAGFNTLEYYHIKDFHGRMFVSRTGYTGEDGFEIISNNDAIVEIWKKVREAGAQPVGLGARDSLRLEMGFPLYGHELEETISPLEAGLKRVVHFDKDDFIGKAALEAQQEEGVKRRRIAFVLQGPGIPRQGYPLSYGGAPIGEVTSGGFSPVLKKGFGLGLVDADYVKTEDLGVEIRGKVVSAKRVKPPFVEKRVKV